MERVSCSGDFCGLEGKRNDVRRVFAEETSEEAERESHVFHVFYPKYEATRLLQQQMSEFMKEN